ncbi:NmrA family NAD(P)-binding protein [Citrobacter sp. MNAZ 1397]|uniref:NmrA family NAD(P)-binding protein n=1 Tax=Citrobacter sp. MNAZ 1397 TaxID=2911205 RepID=UPI002974617C|nr:NmrA family NAD(P)-binding protein [Kluyvera intermedia]HAU8267978.1 NmrA family NAD(P)-binding protein [Kluyvera intermedia]
MATVSQLIFHPRRKLRVIAQGREVRAFVRDPHSEKAQALRAAGITLAIGNLFDRASIEHAMEGIKGVFSVQTSSPRGEISDEQEIIQGKAIADSALATGVSHLVYSSSGAAGKGLTGMGHLFRHWRRCSVR